MFKDKDKDIILSKKLSSILRHRAREENIPINDEGYIKLSDILNHEIFRKKYTADDIKRVVLTNDKKRFSLRTNENSLDLEICANQGHSLVGLNNLCLSPITKVFPFEVIHGTYWKNWDLIKIRGLNRMTRNHIHFAKGLPSDKSVISGMRRNCQVFIYIDLDRALEGGLKFYESVNGVVLSPGDEKGNISPKYFSKVCDKRNRILALEDCKVE